MPLTRCLALLPLLVVHAFAAKARVVLMAGQSNMSGTGRLDCRSLEGTPDHAVCLNTAGETTNPAQAAQMSASTSRILLASTLTGYPMSSFLPLGLPQYDLNSTLCGRQGCLFGPEVGLALWSHLGTSASLQSPLHLIKFHAPGTALCPAASGTWEGSLGDEMRSAFASAIANLGGLANVEIVGMLWLQGEADIYSSCRDSYGSHFRGFMERTWAQFGPFPVVVGMIGGVGDMWDPLGRAVVRSEQARLPMFDPRIRTIDGGDLPVHAFDRAHYNTQSLITLGIRFADCLEDQDKCRISPTVRNHRSLLGD